MFTLLKQVKCVCVWRCRKGEGQVTEAVLNVYLCRHKSALAGDAKEKGSFYSGHIVLSTKTYMHVLACHSNILHFNVPCLLKQNNLKISQFSHAWDNNYIVCISFSVSNNGTKLPCCWVHLTSAQAELIMWVVQRSDIKCVKSGTFLVTLINSFSVSSSCNLRLSLKKNCADDVWIQMFSIITSVYVW